MSGSIEHVRLMPLAFTAGTLPPVTLDVVPVAPPLDPREGIIAAYTHVTTAGETLQAALGNGTKAINANYRPQARAEYRSTSIVVRAAGPVVSLGSLTGAGVALEVAAHGALAAATAITTAAGLAVASAGAGIFHHVRKSRAIRKSAAAKKAEAAAARDAILTEAVNAAKADPSTAIAYRKVADEMIRLRRHGLWPAHVAQLEEIVGIANAAPLHATAEARRYLWLKSALADACNVTHDPEVATFHIDTVSRLFGEMSPAEKQALAPIIMAQVFDARECTTNAVPQAVAAPLFAKLFAAGGRAPVVAVCPPEPTTQDRSQRFAESMITFETALANAVDARAASLSQAVLRFPGSKKDRDRDYGHALNGYDMRELPVFSWLGLGRKRVAVNRGLDPKLMAEAVALASAPWATPLERTGFAFLARRYLTAFEHLGIYCTQAQPALDAIARAGEERASATHTQATAICRALLALNEARPGVTEGTSQHALRAFRALNPADRAGVARAIIPHVFGQGNAPSHREPHLAQISRTLHLALEHTA